MKYPFTRSAFALILLTSLYSIALVFLRQFVTGESGFLFLIWNLGLAWIPFVLAVLIWGLYTGKRTWHFWFLSLLWLLFLPNSFYLITDLVHLRHSVDISFWFDLFMIMSFVWNGLLLGVLSVRLMHDLIEQMVGEYLGWILVQGILLLVAIGIYLGRFLGFNSWDVVANPSHIGSYIATSFIVPQDSLRSYAFVFFFYLFYALVYATFRSLHRGDLLRNLDVE